MKKFPGLMIVLLMGSLSVYSQKFSIKGTMPTHSDSSMIMLTYSNGNDYVKDSIKVNNGHFEFSGNIPEPTKGWLEVMQPHAVSSAAARRDVKEIFLESGVITVKSLDGLLRNAMVKGGAEQTILSDFQEKLQPYEKSLEPLNDSMMKYWNKDEARVELISKQTEPIYNQMDEAQDEFIRTHPDSYVSLALIREKSAVIDPDKLEPEFNVLSKRLKESPAGRKIAERLEIAKRTAVGRKALDFAQNDTTGKPVSLTSLKGKYVLIDFWASWCGPCRAENPSLVKAYNKFRTKNFEIISISLDSQRQAWLKAIQQDKLTWLHVSDLKGWRNVVAEQYGIRAVPQNFLLDTEGVIVAKNLHAEELEKKLETLLN